MQFGVVATGRPLGDADRLGDDLRPDAVAADHRDPESCHCKNLDRGLCEPIGWSGHCLRFTKRKQEGQAMGRARKRIAWAALLAATGCTSDQARRDTRDDPLLGIGARPSSQPAAVATSTPTYNSPPTYAPSPPITPGTPTSNAALAAGGFQPLAGGNDLRIGNGSPTLSAPAGGSVTPTPPSPDPRPSKSSVTPVNGVSPAPPPSYSNSSNSVSPRSGLEAAYASVAAVQPIWHRLTFNSQANEYMFSMSVPNRLNSAAPRTIESAAPSAEQAIRMALDQLTRERE
jgi:hypothetical protein